MNRKEFLTALREKLQGLPDEEIIAAVRYYEEYLDEAENEVEAIEGLGDPEQIAVRILADCEKQAADTPDAAEVAETSTASKEAAQTKKKRSPWKTAGTVVLIVCASPLLIALGAVALSVAIAMAAVVLSVMIGIIAPFLAISVAFIAVFFMLLGTAGSLVGIFTPGAVLLCGLALLFGALGIVCGIFTGYLCKWSGMLLKRICRELKPVKKEAAQA